MRITPVLAAGAAGAVLAAGGVAAFELGTETASGQGAQSNVVTESDVKAANDRAIAAIRLGKTLNNNLGKYFVAQGVAVGVKQPPGVITQDKGTGANGLPTSTLQNGAVTNSKLSSGVQSQLNTIFTAAVFVPFGGQPSLTNGMGATAVTRTTGVGTGAFDVAFGTNNIGQCTWTASVGTVQPGALTPVFGAFTTYATNLNNTALRVFTFNSAGALADAPFQVHVIC